MMKQEYNKTRMKLSNNVSKLNKNVTRLNKLFFVIIFTYATIPLLLQRGYILGYLCLLSPCSCLVSPHSCLVSLCSSLILSPSYLVSTHKKSEYNINVKIKNE